MRKFKKALKKFWGFPAKPGKKNIGYYKITILLIAILCIPIITQLSGRISQVVSRNPNSLINNNLGLSGQETYTTQWLDNPTLDAPIEPTWYSTIEGDLSDTEALSGLGHANLSVIGDYGLMSIDDSLNNIDWTPFNNPEFPISPDSNGSNSAGLFISHEWDEGVDQSRNSPSIHWKNNITMPVNFSDYIITSASLEVIFNASVTAVGSNPSQPHIGGIERPGDYTEGQNPGGGDTQFGIGDFATFYVLISDIGNKNSFQIALNRTTDLGQDTPEINNYADTLMNTVPEEILISYLTAVLEDDNFNFTITLGIEIYCEDNEWNVDIDTWDLLTMRSFNLTFTYEKKINQFSSISWNQNADKISDLSNDTVIVNEAILNFKYKIDQNWPATSSPNSEIRILINNNLHPETIKLSTATSIYQVAKPGGLDVTSLITDDVNLSIQLFLADSFGLNRTITTSIDDVSLNITYTIIFPDKETDLHLFLNNVNKTVDPNFELNVGQQLNLTIKYLNQTGDHITNATVLLSGNFTGTLTEFPSLEQYSIILDTDISNVGINFLTITAQAQNFQLQKIAPTITIDKIAANDLDLFLNGANMTHDPNVALIIGEELNITIKYQDEVGAHIPNATVRLISEGYTTNLNESLAQEQYSVIINSSERFNIGGNQLTIEALTSTFQTKYALINLYVRKINVEIDTLSGSNTIIRNKGQDILLQIRLNNTDFGGFMRNALVSFVSDSGVNGVIEDNDNDGIYEVTLSDLPKGAFTFTVSAIINDNYFIQDFELAIVIIEETEDSTLFQVLFALSIILVGALGSYFIAYYTFLKYPRPVRKVRKYRRTLNKKNDPNVIIVDREKAFSLAFKNETTGNAETPKPRSIEQSPQPEKQVKSSTPKLETEELIEKSLEKKKELDNIIRDPTK